MRRWYLITAAVIAAMTSTYSAWSYLNGFEPGQSVFQPCSTLTGLLVVSWTVTDPAIPSAQKPSFDHGILVWTTFPLLAAYHLYSAHRWRGILVVLGLMGLFAAPSIAIALVYAVG